MEIFHLLIVKFRNYESIHCETVPAIYKYIRELTDDTMMFHVEISLLFKIYLNWNFICHSILATGDKNNYKRFSQYVNT